MKAKDFIFWFKKLVTTTLILETLNQIRRKPLGSEETHEEHVVALIIQVSI